MKRQRRATIKYGPINFPNQARGKRHERRKAAALAKRAAIAKAKDFGRVGK